MNEELMRKARAWKRVGIASLVVAVLAGGFAGFSFWKAKVYTDAAQDAAAAPDAADATVKSRPRSSVAREAGVFIVQHIRNGKVIYEEEVQNLLADEGEAAILDCFYRATNCPSAFTMSLLSTAATPAEGSTWASLQSNEMNSGTNAPGYAEQALTRDATGWSSFDTVNNGTGGCEETTCARVSTAQKIITATADWTASARYLVIRATIGGNQKFMSSAQLLNDRQLANYDQLNLTYRQAMQ